MIEILNSGTTFGKIEVKEMPNSTINGETVYGLYIERGEENLPYLILTKKLVKSDSTLVISQSKDKFWHQPIVLDLHDDYKKGNYKVDMSSCFMVNGGTYGKRVILKCQNLELDSKNFNFIADQTEKGFPTLSINNLKISDCDAGASLIANSLKEAYEVKINAVDNVQFMFSTQKQDVINVDKISSPKFRASLAWGEMNDKRTPYSFNMKEFMIEPSGSGMTLHLNSPHVDLNGCGTTLKYGGESNLYEPVKISASDYIKMQKSPLQDYEAGIVLDFGKSCKFKSFELEYDENLSLAKFRSVDMENTKFTFKNDLPRDRSTHKATEPNKLQVLEATSNLKELNVECDSFLHKCKIDGIGTDTLTFNGSIDLDNCDFSTSQKIVCGDNSFTNANISNYIDGSESRERRHADTEIARIIYPINGTGEETRIVLENPDFRECKRIEISFENSNEDARTGQISLKNDKFVNYPELRFCVDNDGRLFSNTNLYDSGDTTIYSYDANRSEIARNTFSGVNTLESVNAYDCSFENNAVVDSPEVMFFQKPQETINAQGEPIGDIAPIAKKNKTVEVKNFDKRWDIEL